MLKTISHACTQHVLFSSTSSLGPSLLSLGGDTWFDSAWAATGLVEVQFPWWQCTHSCFTRMRDWVSASSSLGTELLLAWDSCFWGQCPTSWWAAPTNVWNPTDFKAFGSQDWMSRAAWQVGGNITSLSAQPEASSKDRRQGWVTVVGQEELEKEKTPWQEHRTGQTSRISCF